MDTKEAGRLGGKRRAEKLTAEQRSRSAKKASKARWAKVRAANRKKSRD